MSRPQLKRTTIVIAACASVGAIAGIAGSAAAPSSNSKSSSAQAQAKAQKQAQRLRARALRRGFRLGPVGPGFARGPVHAQAVVPNPAGTGFITITTDAGTLNSVDGTTVRLKEGTDKATYKDDVAVDVGSSAKVIRNHQDAKLSDLKAGDHVRVITGAPRGNVVIAEDDAFVAKEKKRFQQFKKQFRERGFRHGGLRHGGFGFGPPPGAPAPGAYPGQGGAQSGSSSGGSNS
jgi:type II secretory pathway pseudopilin PulG